ncbi:MAG TPA: DUF58 domain-containing protein [Candidatus Dormibacteraeota bacterium]|nr:DUF58 domain-containing protein [Candidatus Dormibacteraeota bacterium]
MFTLKAVAYLTASIGLLILALLLDDFQIGILVLGLASIFFFSNVWGLPEKVTLQLERQILPSETFGGETIRIESKIRNLTLSSLVNVEVEEALDERITPERGMSHTPISIGPSKDFEMVLEFPSPQRSNYLIGPLTVRVRDPLGLYLTERRLGSETLCVMPRPERLTSMPLRPRHVGPWPGVVPSRVLGMGTDFYSLREYVPGDDPKRINWKASARHNSLIVNETEAERVTDVMIVLDPDIVFFGSGGIELFEREVQAAASVARLLLRQGNRVGLVLQGGERGSAPAGFGKRHERKILYLLAMARPGRPSVSTGYVMNLLAERMLPSRAQIIIISPLLDLGVREGVKQLSIAGYSTLVISPTQSLSETFKDRVEESAFKLVMLERTISLLELERSSRVIDWPVDVPLSAMMTKVRRLRPQAMA